MLVVRIHVLDDPGRPGRAQDFVEAQFIDGHQVSSGLAGGECGSAETQLRAADVCVAVLAVSETLVYAIH